MRVDAADVRNCRETPAVQDISNLVRSTKGAAALKCLVLRHMPGKIRGEKGLIWNRELARMEIRVQEVILNY